MSNSTPFSFTTTINVRRFIFAGLSISTFLLMIWLIDNALSPQIPLTLHIVLVILFAITLPWMVVGFWNAVIGFCLCQLYTDPSRVILPAEMSCSNNLTITSSTAILICIRNESPERVIRNLELTLQGLSAFELDHQHKKDEHFYVYILSDTDDKMIAQQEGIYFEKMISRWQEQYSIIYRRRIDNTGYKAGNIADFCQRWGDQHEFAITLDADSVMTASAMVRLVRMMQSDTQLGILQGLVIGLPSTSAFTRLFQYGMRLGMRSYTVGSAWWQADCGPYWGHNAIIRLAPFIAHCDISKLSNRSDKHDSILSHDLIEAVLMRSAGYEVRIYPQEDQSWEENPPTLKEYIRRDLRWCEGNLQYIRLLSLPKLKLMGRLQLLLAIFMFLGSPAWVALIIIFSIAVYSTNTPLDFINSSPFSLLILIALIMWYLPKIAGALNVLLRKQERERFGGGWRFSLSFTIEILFSLLMTPIAWLNHSIFIVGLMFGKKQGWMGQSRDNHSIALLDAIRHFWIHTLLGITLAVTIFTSDPKILPYALLFLGGLVLAIPMAVITSQPWLGRLMQRYHLLSLPEEILPPEALSILKIEAAEGK